MIRLDAECCCKQHTERFYQMGLRLYFLHWAITCTSFTTLLEFGILSNDAVQENAVIVQLHIKLRKLLMSVKTLYPLSLTDYAVRMYF